ncbi:hypothetical protein VTL71DRAFT_3998 [Oculimacula yallundae]|uniref:Uncharacterized protein n=1 Tax=Oculimacula yallundae TaxID=86028 RepID=A0ABR4C4K3_9HELO
MVVIKQGSATICLYNIHENCESRDLKRGRNKFAGRMERESVEFSLRTRMPLHQKQYSASVERERLEKQIHSSSRRQASTQTSFGEQQQTRQRSMLHHHGQKVAISANRRSYTREESGEESQTRLYIVQVTTTNDPKRSKNKKNKKNDRICRLEHGLAGKRVDWAQGKPAENGLCIIIAGKMAWMGRRTGRGMDGWNRERFGTTTI